jgi:hypothetical protein
MVDPNGNVIITWATPADPANEFQSYDIFYSTNPGGPYAPIFSQTTYTVDNFNSTGFGLNANASQYYFYVKVKNTSNVSMPAIDTVKTISLTMLSPANSSVAYFQWDDFHYPLPAGESAVYKIWREYPTNTWIQVGTVPVHNIPGSYYYHDTISVCQDSIFYRVELDDPILACTSVSNIKGNYFRDLNPPSTAMLDSVSVDVNGNVVMGIHPSSSPDAKCYRIYKWVTALTTYTLVGTVCTTPANSPTIFTYTNSSANSSPEEFTVAAIDSCGNPGVIALNKQATIYLRGNYLVCNKTASLNWTGYENMTGGVDHYEILCSTNSGVTYTHVANTSALVYNHTNLAQGVTYWYRIRAHSILQNNAGRDSITSTSNIYTVNPSTSSIPAFVYLSDVTVNNPAEIVDVKWFIDTSVRAGSFSIYRSDNFNGTYSNVGSAASVAAQSSYTFSDNSANAASKKYFYYVSVMDTCNNPIMKTDTSNTIFLTASASGNFHANLSWNDYSTWLGGVTGYNIYRSLDGVFAGGPVATVPIGTNSYTDDLSNYTTYQGKFTYYVEAVEGPGNTYGLSEKSESNYADIYLDALMFVPNAFVPKGHNKIFLPVGDYVEKSEYKLTIYNRWGDKIFQTTDETQGWDGGQVTEGLYGYVIEFKNAMGEYRQQQGTVTLIR